MADTDFTPDQLQQMRSQVQADKTLSPQDKLQAIGEINKALGSANPSSPASAAAQPEADPLQTFMDKTAIQQKTSQPMDIGGSVGGFFKGLGRGVTADVYDPKLSPAEQGGAAVGDTIGTLGANALLGFGGAALGTLVEPGGGTVLGGAAGPAAYAGLRTAQEEIHSGKPLNPADIGAQTFLGGALGAIAPGEGALLPKIIKGATVGSLGSGAMDAAHQYFNNGGHIMVPEVLQSMGQGAILGGGLPVGERVLGHMIGGKPTEAVPTESANAPEPIKDPVTGMLTMPQTELPPAPAAGPGVLTGKVEYKTEAPETPPSNKAPWDDDNDGGGGSPAPISPETGQPAQTEQQPEQQPENITSAIQQLQQRRALLQQMQQQGQAIEAGQQANQASVNPTPEAVQGAQSAADILRARQQEVLRQQQEQAVQQKADEIHAKLTNYERLGAKSQANKLKAEIAEQAATHPDPIQRAAYQRALDKYAPPEQPTAEAPALPVEQQPVEQPKVTLKGNVSKEGQASEPQGPISNPQGEASQPEGQQHAQEQAQEVQPSGKQEPTGQTEQKALKSTKPRPKSKTTLGHVIGEALSGDYEGFDEPKAFDTLDSLGYEPKQISKEKNTLSHGKQYSVKISGRVRRFGEGDTLAKFLGDNGISADTLGRGVNIRGKSFNVDRLLDNLPDTPAKMRYLEEQGTPQSKEYEQAESHRYEAAQKAYDLIHGSATVDELVSRYNQIFSDQLPMGDWDDIANEFDAKAEELEHALSNDAGGPGSQGKGNGESPKDGGTTEEQVSGSVHSSPESEQPGTVASGKKKVESSLEEGIKAIYPDKPYPKESVLSSTKTQGTAQREHFLEAQAHKAGKFLSPAELESHEGFSEAYDKLTPEEQDKLHALADAITSKKKVKTGFYNPGTETKAGVLTKRAGHGQELYTPAGLSLTKKGDILVHGYNENAELSSRRLDRFSGKVEKTTETGYQGLYKHPSDLNESETFHPADAIVEQVANPILKKQVLGKPIVDSDYRQAGKTLTALVQDLHPDYQNVETVKGILDRLPDPVKEWIKEPKGPCH